MVERKRGDEGVSTSAPASSVGSLLTDLLSEAKKDVAAERQQLERQLNQRVTDEREARAREEARQREAMQQQLVEETRLRNQALAGAKRERPESDRLAIATAPHTRPSVDAAAAAAAAPATAAAIPTPKRRGMPLMLAAAMVLIGAGLGVGGAFAFTPPARVNLPDIQSAAQAIVAQTAKAALAEGRVTKALDDAQTRIKSLETKMEETLAAQKVLAEKVESTQKELDEAKTQLAEAADGKKNGSSGGRPTSHGGSSSGGGLNINTGVFK